MAVSKASHCSLTLEEQHRLTSKVLETLLPAPALLLPAHLRSYGLPVFPLAKYGLDVFPLALCSLLSQPVSFHSFPSHSVLFHSTSSSIPSCSL